MENIEQQLAELREIRNRLALQNRGTDPESLSSRMLRARAIDLTQEFLHGDRTEALFEAFQVEESDQHVLELVDIGIRTAEAQARRHLVGSESEPYLAGLVSRALWSGREIRIAIIAFSVLFAGAIGVLTFGAVQLLDRANAAGELVRQAQSKYEEARIMVDKVESLRSEVQKRIEGFTAGVAAQEKELDRVRAQLGSLNDDAQERLRDFETVVDDSKRKLAEDLQFSEKSAGKQIKEALKEINEKISSYDAELTRAQERVTAATQKSAALDQEIDVRIRVLSERMNAVEALFAAVPTRIESLAHEAIRPVVEDASQKITQISEQEIKPIKKKIEQEDMRLAKISEEIDSRFQSLNKKVGALEALEAQIRVRFGTVEHFSEGIEAVEQSIITSREKIDDISRDLKPVRIIVDQINAHNEPVERRLAQAMAVSSETIAGYLEFLIYSNRWLLAIGGVALVELLWLFVLTWKMFRSHRPPAAPGDAINAGGESG